MAADMRLQEGSSAPGRTEEMVAACREDIAAARTWGSGARARAERAEAALRTRAREIAGT
jgi:hypothetical protein